jgi:probable rRNA maturation factor
MSQIRISVNNQQSLLDIDQERLVAAIQAVLNAQRISAAEISVAVVNDSQIQILNREYLDHDFPTDVLSFLYDSTERSLDGELIISTDTARRTAPEHGMHELDELLLYVVHGTLHLVGFRDDTDEARLEMRAQERRHMRQFGVSLSDSPMTNRTEPQS